MHITPALFSDKIICAIGGGKGGVGKSVMTANIGVGLARLGKKVIAVDADFGGANLHTVLGVRFPRYGLNDFISKSVQSLDDILIDTEVDNLQLISNASDILSLANPKFAQKEKLLRHLQGLDAHIILLDLGAGASYNTLDFFGIADLKIVVVSPEPTSIQNVYGFLKNAIYRKLVRVFSQNIHILSLIHRAINPNHPEKIGSIALLAKMIASIDRQAAERCAAILNSFTPRVIINMAGDSQDKATLHTLKTVCSKYLDIKVDFFGGVAADPQIKKSVKEMRPFLLQKAKGDASASMYQITQNLLKCAYTLKKKNGEELFLKTA